MVLAQCSGFLQTPPLWEKEQFGMHQFDFPEIDLNTFIPETIPTTIRLGHQMEYVFKQLIEASFNYEVIVYNLPIKNEERRLGEIDFILREHHTQQLIHVELTYKFYLIDPEIKEAVHQLVGPNRRDNFYDKMQKIKQRQFALLHTEEGIKALVQHGIDHTQIEHQCCFKAQLFKPYGDTDTNIQPLNHACITGFWLTFNAFRTSEFQHMEYYIPNKSNWVVTPHNAVDWCSHSEVSETIQQQLLKNSAPMIWMKKSETEFEKIFVV